MKGAEEAPSRFGNLPFTFDAAASSDKGTRRESNEDQARIMLRTGLFVVADGMGGHRAGEVASMFAVVSMANSLAPLPPYLPAAERKDALARAVIEANREVFARGRSTEAWLGMGSTLVAAFWCPPNRWAIANVGDSRAYLLRGQTLKQITTDHKGFGHSIYRAIGVAEKVEADLFMVDVEPSDALLLCSDGLYEAVSHDEMASDLRRLRPREAVTSLLQRALDNRARDNVTAIVVRVRP